MAASSLYFRRLQMPNSKVMSLGQPRGQDHEDQVQNGEDHHGLGAVCT